MSDNWGDKFMDDLGKNDGTAQRLSGSTETPCYVCNCGEPPNDRLVLERVKQIAEEWRNTTLTEGGRFQDFLFKKLNT